MSYTADDREILALTARTALVAATDLFVPDGTETLEVVLVQTTHAATPGLTLTLKGANGETLLTSAAIVADGTVVLRYGIGITPVTNLAQQGIPHAGMTIEVAVADSDSATYSIRRRAK